MRRLGSAIIIFFLTLSAGVPALAQSGAADSGDSAWLLTATALVLFMTLPGLALFYGGLVRARHLLSVQMHCMAIACLASLIWLVLGYGLAFGDGGVWQGWIGSFGKAFLAGMTGESVAGSVPEPLFFMFQMTFAIITPALIVGAYPERMRFGAVLLFSGLWLLVVYVPVTHWVWGGGWLAALGVLDFAGGIVVHTTAGVSALVLAAMLGPRRGFPSELRPPHSPGLTMMGAAMLWVGWFGFNGGSALAANGNAAMAMLVTHIAAATASLTWMAIEWLKFGKPSLIGLVTGTIAGLATITPGSGYVGPLGAVVYGLLAGIVCFYAVQVVKHRLRIDDSLDVFAVHGVGGMLGTLLAAFFAASVLGGVGLADGMTVARQLGVQALGVGVVLVLSALATFVILKLTRALVGLRVTAEQEVEGLDITVHGERAYEL
ncbi:MAG: ammonium transporter [Alphaproteobacteria bacterium]|nr:MAG: ammonium transporter [Alphaproteobacteria bacterium]